MQNNKNDLLNQTLARLDKGLKHQINNDDKYITIAGFLNYEFTTLLVKINEIDQKKDNEIKQLKDKIKQSENNKIENEAKKAIMKNIYST